MDIKRKLTIEQELYNRYNQRKWMKINSKIQVQDDVKGVNKSMNVTTIFTIVLIVGICVAAVILAAARICFEIVFRVPKSESLDLYRFPKSEQYSRYTDEMTALIKNAQAIPYEDVWITSFDGLKLHGRFYFTAQNAPTQIMFHGYRSAAVRDFCGGLKEGLDAGYNVLLVDQRAHGESEGKYLTFGISERRDCLAWTEYVCGRMGADSKILIYGISMGAATVLMASGLTLPSNVIGIVADCGYTSPEAIIKKVMHERKYPASVLYPLTRLGAKLYGHYDLEETSAPEALKQSGIPVFFVHGDDDRFVPWEMSRENYQASSAVIKRFLTITGAGHGISYIVDRKKYLTELFEFLDKIKKTKEREERQADQESQAGLGFVTKR